MEVSISVSMLMARANLHVSMYMCVQACTCVYRHGVHVFMHVRGIQYAKTNSPKIAKFDCP